VEGDVAMVGVSVSMTGLACGITGCEVHRSMRVYAMKVKLRARGWHVVLETFSTFAEV
jgi:hypothetical protein